MRSRASSAGALAARQLGSSAESLDSTTQAVLFDAILADTALEDVAAEEAAKEAGKEAAEEAAKEAAKEAGKEAAAVPPRTKGQAVRQALPANLPLVDRLHELGATHCACREAFKRIGEEVSEQLDCVPAQFFA